MTPTTDFSFLQRVIVPFRTGANAGYLLPNTGSMTVWNVVPGGYAWLQVRAWDARLGATYDDVIALGLGGYGESPLFYADGADPTIFQTPAPPYGIQSFSLRPIVPEPSTLALVVVGVGLAFKARRQPRPSQRE